MKTFLLSLLLLLTAIAVSALPRSTAPTGEGLFRLVDTSDGLPDGEVRQVIALPDGRWAVLTSSALSTYDGSAFRSFPLSSDRALAIPYVAGQPTAYADGHRRIWIKEAGRLLVFDLLREAFIAPVDRFLQSMGIDPTVRNVFADSHGRVWFVVSDHQLVSPPADGEPRPIRLHLPTTHDLRDIAFTDAEIWLAYGDGTVVGMRKNTPQPPRHPSVPATVIGRQQLWKHHVHERDFVRFARHGDRLWLMWDRGVARLHPSSHRWEPCYESAPGSTLVSICPLPGGSLAIALRRRGLLLLHPDGSQKLISHLPLIGGDSVDDDIESIQLLGSNLVIALRSKGLCISHPLVQPFPFLSFRHLGVPPAGGYHISGPGPAVFTFPQSLWRLSTDATTMRRLPSTVTDATRSFIDSRGHLWTGSFRQGIYLSTSQGTRHYLQPADPTHDIDRNIIRNFAQDGQGNVWAAFLGGIGRFDEDTQRLQPLSAHLIEGNTGIHAIAFDRTGRLWAATNDGLISIRNDQLSTGKTQPATPPQKATIVLRQACKCLLVDSRGLVWAGGYGGISLHQPSDKSTRRFGLAQGMPNEAIQAIIEDGQGCVWATTANGLCRFRPTHEGNFELTVFNSGTFLTDGKFLPWAAARCGDRLIFGCADGFYVVTPSQLHLPTYTGHPVFTSLQVNNHEIGPGQEHDGHVILPSALPFTDHIRLRHHDNFLTIHFAGLNFDMPRHTYYRHRLQGIDADWVETSPADGIGRASYTSLPPGTYRLEVCSAGLNHQWSRPQTLTIEVLPPWWATWWARTLYLLTAMAAAIGAYRWKRRQDLRRMEEEKTRELDEMKYRFFTNISHEFRTLLTLIITPVSSLLQRVHDPEEKARLTTVNRNAADLLQLVNQLLDFRKMDMNGERLNLSGGSLDELIGYTVAKFQSLAEQKDIHLNYHTDGHHLFMNFDHDKVGKILANLLSNALKFTEPGGLVTVCLSACIHDSRRYACISVTDNGCGINAADQKRIFDRFYRVNDQATTHAGSGIGLNMAAEYAKMHQGSISVSSEPGKGSCFTVQLPADLNLPTDRPDTTSEATTDGQSQPPSQAAHEQQDKTVLVVEDNREFRTFLVSELSHIYNKVEEASDGIEGALKAEADSPDIIISDVMMPRMSGTEMCRRLKDNIATSHIPVILLTAWSTDESRTEGYKAGADAYIAKPFPMDVLLARIENLLRKQQQRIDSFSHNTSLDPGILTDSNADEQLLREIIEAIRQHLADSDYTIDTLARDISMSRMSLYRKMKSISGQTPADFIRTVRLKSAAELLRTGRYTVAEVAYRTGFASPQNFSKHFKTMFGQLPSAYMNS